MSLELNRSRRTVVALLTTAFVGLAPGCDDGCEDGRELVCNQDGDDCFCGVQCTSDEDCASGQYCLEGEVCVGVYVDLAEQHGCGHLGAPCCALSTAQHASLPTCLLGLRCEADTCTDR